VIDDKNTRERFENIMNAFAEVFGKPTSRIKNRIYFTALEDYPIEEIEKASRQLIKEKRISTFPVPSEITEKMNKSEDELLLDASKAWNEADRISFLGKENSNDPILNEVITIAFGSWQNFGQADTNDPFDRKHFIECYKSVIKDKRLKQLKEGTSHELVKG